MPGYTVCMHCGRQHTGTQCPECRQEQGAPYAPPWHAGQRVTYLSHPSSSLGKLVVEPLEATYLGPAPGGRVTIEVLIPGKRTRQGVTAATRVQMRVLPTEIRAR